jgi:hypothetical protein
MKLNAFLFSCALTACAGGVAAPKSPVVSTVASPQAPLASYRTFSFGLSDQPMAGFAVTPRSLEVQRRLRPAVREALLRLGYVEDQAKGDFVVTLATGSGSIESPAMERSNAAGLIRGFIGIHIYDAATSTEVWQGSASAEINPQNIDDSLLKMGVERMLADFPMRKGVQVASIH